MMIPDFLQQYIFESCQKNQFPAYIKVDHQGAILETGGCTDRYGLASLDESEPVTDQLPILEGIIPFEEPSFTVPMVRIYDVYADIIAINHGECFYILLLDVTPEANNQYLLQQKANELHLLKNKQAKLMSELEFLNNKLQNLNHELEDRVQQRTADLVLANENLKREMKERAKAEEGLRQAQKMEAIGQLAGGIAHDFNNMMTIVIGYSEMVMLELSKQTDLYEFMNEIHKAGELATSIARQLLTFSRQDTVQARSVNLNETIHNLNKMMLRLVGADQKLILTLSEETPIIWIDPGQIEQVLLNLVVNARDAMPEGGKIAISTEITQLEDSDIHSSQPSLQKEFIHLRVQDHGTGIKPEILDKIFDPFFTTKAVGKGTGLGLSVLYGIIHKQNGWIDVDSELGVGTTFNIYLPISTRDSEITPVFESIDDKDIKDKLSILVIEDNDSVRKYTTRILTISGFLVTPAPNGTQALELFLKNPDAFDFVFSDVILPDISGIKLVNHMQCIRPDLPVLLSSAYTDSKAQWKTIQEKGYPFIQKPYNAASLTESINNALRNKDNSSI